MTSIVIPTKVGIYHRCWIPAFAGMTIILCAFQLSAARYPQLLRLKGRFTDSKVPLTDNLEVRFSIWDKEEGYGNLLWQDVQTVSIQQDMFEVVLGRMKPLTPSVFSGGDRWVELQLGNDAPMRPRHKIPNEQLQAQVAAVQVVPPPAAVPAPPAPVVPAPPAPVVPVPAAAPPMTDQERHDLELQLEKYREAARKPAPKPAKRKQVVPPSDSSGGLGPVYEVQTGDTLKSIAQKLYGNAELWYDLYYLNRDRLGPMGHLFPDKRWSCQRKSPEGEGNERRKAL